MLPLLVLSLGVVTISIERFLALRREKIFPPALIDQISELSRSPNGLEPARRLPSLSTIPFLRFLCHSLDAGESRSTANGNGKCSF